MMKKIYVGALLVSMLTQPVFAMEEERKNDSMHTVVRSPEEQKKLNEELCDAAKKDDLILVEKLLDEGAFISKDREWQEVLQKSFEEGNVAILKLVFRCNNNLIEAVKKGDVLRVEQLLSDGADVNAKDNTVINYSSLHWACLDGNIEIVKLLLAHKDVQVNIIDSDPTKNTPLHISCLRGNIEIVKLLLDHKDIQVNAATVFGVTPLMVLASSKKNDAIEIMKLLLAHRDIKVNMQEHRGLNCLHAVYRHKGDSEKIKLMLKSLIKPAFSWQQQRLIWAGWMKEEQVDCNLAKLPIEMICYILSFCGDKKNNIEALKSFVCHQDKIGLTAFTRATTLVKKELGHILDPQSWQDDQTAENTYDALVKRLQEDEKKQSTQNGLQQE